MREIVVLQHHDCETLGTIAGLGRICKRDCAMRGWAQVHGKSSDSLACRPFVTRDSNAARGTSDRDLLAVESGERKPVVVLVVKVGLVAQQTDRDLLAQKHPLHDILPPVDSGEHPAETDV